MSHIAYQDQVYLESVTNDAIKNRIIWINDEVNPESMTKAIYMLRKLENMDKLTGVKQPITIVCNSPGGHCYQGFLFCSIMEEMIKRGYEIITETGGMSASMSFMIGLMGSKRVCHKWSSFLCHQPSCGMIGEYIKFKREADELERIWLIMRDMIKRKSKMTDELLDSITNNVLDFTIGAEKALELGIVDEIL